MPDDKMDAGGVCSTQDERMKMAASLESANYPRNDFD
jgi:hypothetical protein